MIGTQTVGGDFAYASYGEVYNTFLGSTIEWMFTGDLTELDSGYLFDTPNREFAGKNQGRWLSPDPAGAEWNQYAYATNPLSSADPSGLAQCPIDYDMLYDTAGDALAGVEGMHEGKASFDAALAAGDLIWELLQ